MIFISHARKDSPVVDSFVERIFRLGFEFPSNSIFYTSHPDTAIPAGEYINGTIFDNLHASKLIILIISKHYLSSPYCMCELGASRLLFQKNAKVIPFIFPDLQYADVPAVFAENMINRLDRDGTDSLIDCIVETFPQKKGHRPSGPQRHAASFIDGLPKALKEIPPITTCSVEEYQKLESEYSSMVQELNQAEEKLAQLQDYINQLEALKDAEAVKKIKRKRAVQVEDLYEELRSAAKEQMGKLSNDGKLTYFYLWKYDKQEATQRVTREGLDINYDTDNDYFDSSSGYVELGESSSSITESISRLRSFLDGDDLDESIDFDDLENFMADDSDRKLNKLDYWKKNLF